MSQRSHFEDLGAIQRYARTLLPCVYDDFVAEARAVLSHTQRNALRKLLDFHFRRNSRDNWDKRRLMLVEKLVSERAKEILD